MKATASATEAAAKPPAPRWKRWLKRGLAGVGVLLGLTAAAAGVWAIVNPSGAAYLRQSVQGQLQLLSGGEPVAKLLADPATKPALKKQLQMVADVKRFAEERLKLRPTRNYERFLDLKRDYLVMVLTASPPLKLESHTWWFPVVGTVPYIGFFDKQMGLDTEKKLQAQGFETHYRPSPAYSTLGWFNDPLLNTMIIYGDYYLANTVIHESVHATHWVPGEVTFNENMASFIGNQGALQYYKEKFGESSKLYRETRAQLDDQELFAIFMNGASKELKELYDSSASDAEKTRRKPEVIKAIKARYVKEFLPKVSSKGYDGFQDREWNNAMMMSYLHYNAEQEKFEKVFAKLGRDIPKMMEFLKQKDVMKKLDEEAKG